MLRTTTVVCCLGLALATSPVTRSREKIRAFREFLESTQSNNSDYVARLASADEYSNMEELSGKYQGDILLDSWIIKDMVQNYAQGHDAYTLPSTKWPNDTVVWELGEGEFGPLQSAAIDDSIADIADHTCISFRYREPSDTVFVRVTGDPSGCYAHVGYWQSRGIHTLNLARNTPGVGCFKHATIVHQWMHILGFLHMQSSYNRDDYVRIATEHLQPGTEHHLDIFASDLVSNLDIGYDYLSCLHYSAYAFSMSGLPTIVALREHEGLMGQRVYVPEKDWQRINRHYNCPGAWD